MTNNKTNEPTGDAELEDTRDLETKLRQDLGLLEWQIRDLMPIIENHYAQPTKPVNGELLDLDSVLIEVRHGRMSNTKAMQLFAAHLQTAATEAERQGVVKGIKLVDEALLDDITGSYPVQVVRNLIKLLIWENSPKPTQLTQSNNNPTGEK